MPPDVPTPGEGNQPDKPLTKEDVTSIVTEVVNRAISARNKDFEKKLDGKIDGKLTEIGTSLQSFTEKFDETIAKLTPKPADPKPPEKAADPNAPPVPPPEVKIEEHPAFKKLTKQFEDLSKKYEVSEKEKAATTAQLRDTNLRSKVKGALESVKVSAIDDAAGILIDARKRIRYADDKTDDIVFVDDDGETTDLKTGVTKWASSDAAKIYLPPLGAQGSGDKGGGSAPKPKTEQPNITQTLLSAIPGL